MCGSEDGGARRGRQYPFGPNGPGNLLHHVGVVAKKVCAAETAAAYEGDDNIPSGPTGEG